MKRKVILVSVCMVVLGLLLGMMAVEAYSEGRKDCYCQSTGCMYLLDDACQSMGMVCEGWGVVVQTCVWTSCHTLYHIRCSAEGDRKYWTSEVCEDQDCHWCDGRL